MKRIVKEIAIPVIVVIMFLGFFVGDYYNTYHVPENQLTHNEKRVLHHLGAQYSFMREGSMTYITWLGVIPVGEGHHHYHLENGKIYGQTGAITELVIDENGSVCVGSDE